MATVAELLAGLKSGCSEEAVAVEKKEPGLVGRARTEIVAVALGIMLPSLTETTPPA